MRLMVDNNVGIAIRDHGLSFQGDSTAGWVARVSDLFFVFVSSIRNCLIRGRYREADIQGLLKTPEAITFFRCWLGEKE
jgi:hypothetical protein